MRTPVRSYVRPVARTVSPVMGLVNKITIVVLVYNRFENMKRWIDCWKVCDQSNGELVIIHNYDRGMDTEKYFEYCRLNGVRYVNRVNTGFDIGAFQDVCRERLIGFNNQWQALLWISDDTWPMRRDLVSFFLKGINEVGVGVSCMEISNEVTPHVRTTGFCIRKEVATRLQFPADPMMTKQHCYLFEHRGGQRTMYRQLTAMGVKVTMVSGLGMSPLWDAHHRKTLKREQEHYREFSVVPVITQVKDKVVFICLAYNKFPEIVSSLINQTHKNWELVLIHDGPCKMNMKGILEAINDPRINYIETKVHAGVWGHSLRQWALNELRDGRLSDGEYVVITNADNHHVPTYIEYMLKGFKRNPGAVAVYCSEMVHSYRAWDSQKCRFERGWIDCAGVMIKRDVATTVGWNSMDHSADWFFFEDIARRYGKDKFQVVKGCLLIHN